MAAAAKAKAKDDASSASVKDTGSKTACAFPKFLELPAEVRAMIWSASLPAGDSPATYLWTIDFARQLKANRPTRPLNGRPLIEVLSSPPAIQFTCREARDAVNTWVKEWKLIKVLSVETGGHVFVRGWDPERDALYVGRAEWEAFFDRLGRASMSDVVGKVRHLALPSFTPYYSLRTLAYMMEYMRGLRRIYVVWGSQPTRKYLPLRKREESAEEGREGADGGQEGETDAQAAEAETTDGAAELAGAPANGSNNSTENDGNDEDEESGENGDAGTRRTTRRSITADADPETLVTLEDVQYDGPLENHPLLELDPSGQMLNTLLHQGELDSEAASELDALLEELGSELSDQDGDFGGDDHFGDEDNDDEESEDHETSDDEFYYHPSPGEIEEGRLRDQHAAMLHRVRFLAAQAAAQSALADAQAADAANDNDNATRDGGGDQHNQNDRGNGGGGLPWVAAPIQPRWELEIETSETVRMELQDPRRREPLVEEGLLKDYMDEVYQDLAFTEIPECYVDKELGECSLDFAPCKAVRG